MFPALKVCAVGYVKTIAFEPLVRSDGVVNTIVVAFFDEIVAVVPSTVIEVTKSKFVPVIVLVCPPALRA